MDIDSKRVYTVYIRTNVSMHADYGGMNEINTQLFGPIL